MAEPYYCTIADLRTRLGVDDTTLPDPAALALIEDTEDIVDILLGGWPIDDDTGRKLDSDDVETWQWNKLTRFTVLLAAKLYASPELVNGIQWTSQSGPDFSFSGPVGSQLGPVLMGILNDSGLRRIAGRATAGPNNTRPLAMRFFGSNRYEGM